MGELGPHLRGRLPHPYIREDTSVTEENKNAPEEGGKNLQRRTKRRTSTYKHVNIDRQRPKLTREGEGASP